MTNEKEYIEVNPDGSVEEEIQDEQEQMPEPDTEIERKEQERDDYAPTDDEIFEEPSQDMTEVFEKVITPKSERFDKDINRDTKLTVNTPQTLQFELQLKTMIALCKRGGLTRAENFYRGFLKYYECGLASINGATLKALISKHQTLTKEVSEKRARSFFGIRF